MYREPGDSGTSETTANSCRITWHYGPEGNIFHSHCHYYFQSHIEVVIYKLNFFPDRCNSGRTDQRTWQNHFRFDISIEHSTWWELGLCSVVCKSR